jgi:hypothetical protein
MRTHHITSHPTHPIPHTFRTRLAQRISASPSPSSPSNSQFSITTHIWVVFQLPHFNFPRACISKMKNLHFKTHYLQSLPFEWRHYPHSVFSSLLTLCPLSCNLSSFNRNATTVCCKSLSKPQSQSGRDELHNKSRRS